MKSSTDSILGNAHLIIIMMTLAIASVASTLNFKQISADQNYAWFGYVPTSIQPVQIPSGYHAVAQQDNDEIQSETSPVM